MRSRASLFAALWLLSWLLSGTLGTLAQEAPCQRATVPSEVEQTLADAEGRTVCVELGFSDSAFKAWSFTGYDLRTADSSNVTINCAGGRISGLYTHPIVIGDDSLLRMTACDVYTYENSVGVNPELQAFFLPAHADQGARFDFLDSFRYWPCNEIKQVYERAFQQHEEDPGPDPFQVGPVVTNDGSSAFTFIDAHPFRITRKLPLTFRNVTYYCGHQSTRWRNAVAAQQAAATSGPSPMRIKPGDFPSTDAGTNATDGSGRSSPTSVIVAVVVSAAMLVAIAAATGLCLQHRRRSRREHELATDALELPVAHGAALPGLYAAAPKDVVGLRTGDDAADGKPHQPHLPSFGSAGGASSSHNPHSALSVRSLNAPSSRGALHSADAMRAGTRVFQETDTTANLMSSMLHSWSDGGTERLTAGNASLRSGTDPVHLGETDQLSTQGAALVSRLAVDVSELQHDIGDGALVKHCLIGAGAFSLVYRGTWRGIEVAVKAVVFNGGTDQMDTKRIVSEVAIAMSIAHENIVGTYTHDVAPLEPGNSACNLYKLRLVQEYCNGGSLMALLKDDNLQQQLKTQRQPLLLELRMLRMVASALRYLHSRRIIHADVKASNVMLKYDANEFSSLAEALLAGGATLKVMDFGLAQRVREQDPHLSFHAGTRWYAAPEVVNEGHLFKASDVYSFGVMAWEIVTHLPIVQRTPAKTSVSGGTRSAGAPSSDDRSGWMRNTAFPDIPDDVPEPVRALVAQCLLEAQAERPTFAEVVATLENLIVWAEEQ